jgi:hypothetical protein
MPSTAALIVVEKSLFGEVVARDFPEARVVDHLRSLQHQIRQR